MHDDPFESESRRLRLLAISATESVVDGVDWLRIETDPLGAIFAPACELTTRDGAHVAFVQLHAQGGVVSIAHGGDHELHHLDDLPETEALSEIRRLISRVAAEGAEPRHL
jgi:hypothetical protein